MSSTVKTRNEEYAYIGTELELFAAATNWKKYLGATIQNAIKGDVLDVGAGIGNNIEIFRNSECRKWVCLEPDKSLFGVLEGKIVSLDRLVSASHGTIESLKSDEFFDTVLYVDVLEHIEDHRKEIEQIFNHIKAGGHLIVVVPAFQFLFSEFDASIGHYRRYNKKQLVNLFRANIKWKIDTLKYLDSLGMLLNLGNKLILRKSVPNAAQIEMWDKKILPLSCVFDKLVNYSFGRSLLLIASKSC